MHPIVTPEDVDGHVIGLLLTLADCGPGWHPLSTFDLDGVYDAGWRRYVGQVTRAAAERGFVERRRASAGMQLRLTDAGRARLPIHPLHRRHPPAAVPARPAADNPAAPTPAGVDHVEIPAATAWAAQAALLGG